MRAAILGVLFAAGAGCSFGPRALERSYGRYAESVRKVQDEQLLRQLVHLRYNETSVDLDVTSIAAQYELDAGAEARPFFIAPNPSNSNVIFKTFTSILPDVTLSGSNRPTVSLVPIDDGAAVRRHLTPITLDTLVFLTQTSWPVDTIVRMWVERANGVPNAVPTSGPRRDQHPDYERFQRAAELMQAVQDRELGAIRTEERVTEVGSPIPAESLTAAAQVEASKAGLEYRSRPDGKLALVRKERRLVVQVSPGAENAPEMIELAGLLNLVPGRRSYDVALAARGDPDPAKFPTAPGTELRLVLRSTAQAAFFLANGIEVPEEHLCAGVAQPVNGAEGHPMDPAEITRGLFAVHACKGHKPPPTAFVAIHYRGYWYYIDDRDHQSKTTFALLSYLGRLDFARQSLGGVPALTLPVGR